MLDCLQPGEVTIGHYLTESGSKFVEFVEQIVAELSQLAHAVLQTNIAVQEADRRHTTSQVLHCHPSRTVRLIAMTCGCHM